MRGNEEKRMLLRNVRKRVPVDADFVHLRVLTSIYRMKKKKKTERRFLVHLPIMFELLTVWRASNLPLCEKTLMKGSFNVKCILSADTSK